jgi:hypothetical protein
LLNQYLVTLTTQGEERPDLLVADANQISAVIGCTP